MSGVKVAFLHGLSQEIVSLVSSYAPDGFEVAALSGNLSEEQQIDVIKDSDFIMIYRAEIKDRVLRAASKVRLIQLLAAGYETMNLKLMRELDIPCAHNSGANSWAVADHVLLLMLALFRRLLLVDQTTREGRWRAAVTGLNTYEMARKQVGIVGIGNIGRKVARRVQSFEAQVQYHDKFRLRPEDEEKENLRWTTIDDLFTTSDLITCHTPLTEETRHLVNAERLSLMKPTAVLINTSRGAVVDEAALIEALREGRIAGAGLDVFEKEPVEPGNPLLEMDNVVVTPHCAGTTVDTWQRRAEFAYGNMKRVWSGEAPLAQVGNERK